MTMAARSKLPTACIACIALLAGVWIGVNLRALALVSYFPKDFLLDDAPTKVARKMYKRPPTITTRKHVKSHTQPITIGYAISLIKCGDKQTTPAGLMDAAIVLRHSIHMTSVRNPSSGSNYDYKMYAIVHKQAEECSSVLKQVGFQVIVTDSPVDKKEIRGDFLRKHISREWCCGADEFVKLYAYSKIPEPVVVHVDIDFAFMQPMDELFDAILLDADSAEGKQARSRIALERSDRPLPHKIDAFFTLDWPQVIPGRKPGFQAGFMVIRPNETVVHELVEIIKEGNYTEGFSRQNGWHSSGHGAYVGAMAMQGLMSSYYEFVRPEHAVELNQCRYNWMGMDVRYRAAPSFHPKRYPELVGTCRNHRNECEDCMNVDMNLVKSVHYTVCRKPWNCISEGKDGGRYENGNKGAIDTKTGRLEPCLEMVRKWHEYRTDFERKLYGLTNDTVILSGSMGDFKQSLFQGHCKAEGPSGYLQLQATQESFQQVPKLYDTPIAQQR